MNKAGLKKSIAAGIGFEALLLLPLAFGGFGPCGPSNPFAYLTILAHTPFIFIVSPFLSHDEPGVFGTALILLPALATWISLMHFLFFRTKKLKNVSEHETGQPG